MGLVQGTSCTVQLNGFGARDCTVQLNGFGARDTTEWVWYKGQIMSIQYYLLSFVYCQTHCTLAHPAIFAVVP